MSTKEGATAPLRAVAEGEAAAPVPDERAHSTP